MKHMPFDGRRVLALESRRAEEMATLIRKQGGEPFVAPSMREVPIERNAHAFEFADALENGNFELVILLTGVGTRYLDKILDGRLQRALPNVTVVARGPKPMAVLREWGLVPGRNRQVILIPEPNTWREILVAMRPRPERRLAVQEYGRSSPELMNGLCELGCTVTAVPVYQWDLPEDTAPLRQAVHRLAANDFDCALFTTSIQIPHLLQIAREEGVEGAVRHRLAQIKIGSIGPTTSEALREENIPVTMEPSHPKMGILVAECAAECAAAYAAERANG